MDNDTPSSSAAAVAMDVVDALRQSSRAGAHFDDEELRRYFVTSPQSQSGEHSSMGMVNTASSSSIGCPYQQSPAPSQASGGPAAEPPSGALQTALAALGDHGRQQLLAILQLAAAGSQQGASGSGHASDHAAPFAAAFGPAAGSGTSAYLPHTHGSTSSSSNSPSQGDGSNSSSSGRADPNADAAALLAAQVGGLPSFYSKAFQRYSAQHASPQQQQGPSANNTSQQSNNASTPNSNSNLSAKPSPALSAVTSHSQQMANGVYNAHTQLPLRQQSGNYHQQGQPYGQQNYTAPSVSSSMNFAMPDANFFRSPGNYASHGGIPGTSSTAFYSENGNSEDMDLLFTPLMSPALTASTQPGPSVGPLPESFANMSTHSLQKYPDHLNGNQGVAPTTVFSPLTSPALRPQGHSQPAPAQFNNGTTSPPKPQANKGNGKIRGASKNGPKTRPSPIIRPTVDTENYSSKAQNGSVSKSTSRNSSSNASSAARRTSQQSHSAVHSPVSTSGLTSFPQPHFRQQSNSVPASPAFYPTSSNAFTSANATGSARPFSNLNMSRLQENIAQTAVQNSPSPHQFDLSGVLPAFLNMPHLQQLQTSSGTTHAQAPSSQPYSTSQPQNSVPPMSSLDDLMALPSPLDLNNILNTLYQNNGTGLSPTGQQPDSLPSNAFAFPSAQTQSAVAPHMGINSLDAMMLNNYHHQQQQPMSQDQVARSSASQEHDANASRQADVSATGQTQKAAPLTPASFMNLPANQYSVLSGLLADHQHPSPQLRPNSTDAMQNDAPQDSRRATKTGLDGRTTSISKETLPAPAHQAYDASMHVDQAMKQTSHLPAVTSEEMHSSIALNATSPVSPALLAQNIKQVAAAAIAAKDAKSRSKTKNSSRRRSSGAAQGADGTMDDRNDGKRKSKKEYSANGDTVGSPEKPFSLDDGPSTTASAYGGSGPASTETSPMLSAQPDSRKSSHKVAEQRRRDSLKLCFEELRFILPPINPDEDEDFNGGPGSRRPGENNVGGQRGKNYTVDPHHPNKGISKVAMLRKSNEYVTKLHDRIDRRDAAIRMLREELRLCRVALGQGAPGDEAGLDALSNVDFEELEQDNDCIPPTYRLHGLHAPGSKLSLSAAVRVYQPTQQTIAEEDDNEEEEGDCVKDGEYKAKKVKRSSGAARISTRNTKSSVA